MPRRHPESRFAAADIQSPTPRPDRHTQVSTARSGQQHPTESPYRYLNHISRATGATNPQFKNSVMTGQAWRPYQHPEPIAVRLYQARRTQHGASVRDEGDPVAGNGITMFLLSARVLPINDWFRGLAML
jgi:hypothetical protein